MIYTLDNVIKSRAQGAGYSLHIRRLRVASGEQVALTGPSGCGKSTALDILGMLLQPDSASTFRLAVPARESASAHEGTYGNKQEDTDVAALWNTRQLDAMASLRLHHVGYVLQTGGLLPYLTVAENMALTARMQGRTPDFVESSVRELAQALGIESLLHSLPSTLSVGERQRVAIGRALAPHPKIVLADEPTAALDPVHADKVMALFRRAVLSLKATLIMVTHDVNLARAEGLREVRVIVEDLSLQTGHHGQHGQPRQDEQHTEGNSSSDGGVRAIINDGESACTTYDS